MLVGRMGWNVQPSFRPIPGFCIYCLVILHIVVVHGFSCWMYGSKGQSRERLKTYTAKESCNCAFDDKDVYKATLYTCIYNVALLLSLLETAEVS